MQRVAQDWLVLTQLTAHNATAVGVVMALQYGPHLVLLPFTGYAADLLDRRNLLLATQLGMSVLAAVLGLLTITGAIRLWGGLCDSAGAGLHHRLRRAGAPKFRLGAGR